MSLVGADGKPVVKAQDKQRVDWAFEVAVLESGAVELYQYGTEFPVRRDVSLDDIVSAISNVDEYSLVSYNTAHRKYATSFTVYCASTGNVSVFPGKTDVLDPVGLPTNAHIKGGLEVVKAQSVAQMAASMAAQVAVQATMSVLSQQMQAAQDAQLARSLKL